MKMLLWFPQSVRRGEGSTFATVTDSPVGQYGRKTLGFHSMKAIPSATLTHTVQELSSLHRV